MKKAAGVTRGFPYLDTTDLGAIFQQVFKPEG
jgi:hypothetical protein